MENKPLCNHLLNNATIKKTDVHGKYSVKMAVFQTPAVTGTE